MSVVNQQLIESDQSDGSVSSEEDVDSGIVDEVTERRRVTDCMDLSEFFSYW